MKLLLFTILSLFIINSIFALPENVEYCSTWSAPQYSSINNKPPVDLKGKSLRQIIRTSIKGEYLRFHFSNFVDSNPLELLSVHVAISAGQGTGKIIPETDTVITFNGGSEEVVIPGNGNVVSDTIKFNAPALTELAITAYFGEVPEVWTGHPGARTFSYIEDGNVVSQETFTHDNKTDHWYSLYIIDVLTEEECEVIVCYGDSITDGRGTTTDKQNRWSDILATRIQTNPATKHLAVVNQGIGGSSVGNMYYDNVWPSGVARLEKDVFSLSGVKYIVMLYGINDVVYGSNPTAAGIIEGYKSIIERCHAKGIKVYAATVLPFGKHELWSEEGESIRNELNDFIMNVPASEGGFDDYVDFATVMTDPENSLYLNQQWNDYNDGLHPNAIGYDVMGSFIDLDLFVTDLEEVIEEEEIEDVTDNVDITDEDSEFDSETETEDVTAVF